MAVRRTDRSCGPRVLRADHHQYWNPHSAVRSCPNDHILLHADSAYAILSEHRQAVANTRATVPDTVGLGWVQLGPDNAHLPGAYAGSYGQPSGGAVIDARTRWKTLSVTSYAIAAQRST